ncbi:MAG: hypothetical protein KGJ98_07175 [Chloroflexota bacterium]|nr:hypothetical protein [Chloroflexota bacterium]
MLPRPPRRVAAIDAAGPGARRGASGIVDTLGLGHGSIVRSAAITSALTFGAQLMAVALQLVFAALFGTSSETDAYFAALALPTFVAAVVGAAIPVAVVPAVVGARQRPGRSLDEDIGSGAVNLVALGTALPIAVALLFADPVLAAYAPGLPPATAVIARRLALILWPSAVTSSLVIVLTALWQADRRFGWPATVPLVGTGATILALVTLAPALGIAGAALAWSLGVLAETALLAPVVLRRWRPRLPLADPSLRIVMTAAWPLVIANVFIQASAIWERYLASLLPARELSRLIYASQISLALGILLSAGPAAVMLPRFSEVATAGDRARLGREVGRGLRSMWLVVAPAAVLVAVLAEPSVTLVLQRGAFTSADSHDVAILLRMYVVALVPGVLAVVTARALYALRATRMVAAVGIVEGVAYLVYTAWLSARLGAVGIAAGFAIFASVSLVWQLVYLGRLLPTRWPRALGAFVAIGCGAAISGLVAYGVSTGVAGALGRVLAGGTAGVTAYVGLVIVVLWRLRRSSESTA